MMDLRQFTHTPTLDAAPAAGSAAQQPQQQQQSVNRRPSISSMSSASGYASSTYGGGGNTSMNPMHPNTTGNSLLSSRVTQSRHFGTATNITNANTPTNTNNNNTGGANGSNMLNNQNLAFNSTWLPQQNSNSILNVTPWIEQQAKVSPLVNSSGPSTINGINMQSLSMSSLSPNNENGNFNLPGTSATTTGGAGVSNQPVSRPVVAPQAQQANTTKPQTSQSSKASTPLATPTEELKKKLDTTDGGAAVNGTQVDGKKSLDNENAKKSPSPSKADESSAETSANGNGNDDDDLIPTAIVIKNIPFAIKKEQLLDVMTKLNLPLPYAFNYHFDNGVFRGLAFANFTSTDETTLVVNQLNGREIGGRKLRVEYKKMLPVQERERIEREKREKRGQLEEQHRSTSTASLASLYSVASAPAGAKLHPAQQQAAAAAAAAAQQNHHHIASNNAQQQQQQASLQHPQQQQQQQQQPVPPQLAQQHHQPQAQKIPPQMQQQQQLPPHHQAIGGISDRYYASLTGIAPPWNLDFNDPDTLELYTQFVLFRDDKDKTHSELYYPASLTPSQRKVIPMLAHFVQLIESSENGAIILKRKLINSPSSSASTPVSNQANQVLSHHHQHPQQQQPPQQQHMAHNPLFRSQSQSSLGLLQAQNPRYRNSSGISLSQQFAQPAAQSQPGQISQQPQQPYQQQAQSPQSAMKTSFVNKSSSNLASLRNPNTMQQQQQQQQPTSQAQPFASQASTANGFMPYLHQQQQQQGQAGQTPQHPQYHQQPQHQQFGAFNHPAVPAPPSLSHPHSHPSQQLSAYSSSQQHQPFVGGGAPHASGNPQHQSNATTSTSTATDHGKAFLDDSLIASVENLTFN